MKISYAELAKKLGLDRPLEPYALQPWMAHDTERGITCEAEVRCNGDQTLIEAEIQFMYENPPEGKPAFEQTCLLKAEKRVRLNGEYAVTDIWIKGENYNNRFYDWEEKSCNFFRACVREIKAGRIPDIDAILKTEMKDSGFFGTNRGDGSNKSPKINTNNLLYDMKHKGGRGF